MKMTETDKTCRLLLYVLCYRYRGLITCRSGILLMKSLTEPIMLTLICSQCKSSASLLLYNVVLFMKIDLNFIWHTMKVKDKGRNL